MKLFNVICLLVTAAAFAAYAASFPFITLNNKTNRVSDSGSALTYNGVTVGNSVPGTVSNNVASAGLLAVDATKTNGIAATAAHVTSALGFAPQATNSALTALASNPSLYQATNANLTALAANASLYQATNANLTSVAAGGGVAANWNASGTTNSTISGSASGNSAWFTNGVSWTGWYNVKDPAFGAVGNGTNDDTSAIQAAINQTATASGGIVYLPPGIYKITGELTFKKSTRLIGAGQSYSYNFGAKTNYMTLIDATAVTSAPAIRLAVNGVSSTVESIGIMGPQTISTSYGIYACQHAFAIIRDVYILGFNYGIMLTGSVHTRVYNTSTMAAYSYGIVLGLGGCSGETYDEIFGCFFANTSHGPNVGMIDGTRCNFYDSEIDEAFNNAYTVEVRNAVDCSFNNCLVFSSHGTGGGFLISTNSSGVATRTTLNNVRISAFDNTRVFTNTLKIVGGAVDTRLMNVTTSPTPGSGDISDAGTRTIYFNVNGTTKLPANSVANALTIGGTTTLTTNQHTYLINANAQTITLPTASGAAGVLYEVKLISPGATGTVATTSSELIDGATTYGLSASNKYVRVRSDGTNWWNIGSN